MAWHLAIFLYTLRLYTFIHDAAFVYSRELSCPDLENKCFVTVHTNCHYVD